MRCRLSAALIAATVLLGGCSAYRGGLTAIKRQTDSHFVSVRKSDFPSGDPREGADGAPGSRTLAFAAQGHEAVAEAVRVHGIPDAIAITGGSGLAVELAYLEPPVVHTVALVGYWRAETSERPLSAAERAEVDPELILRDRAERLRARVALAGRLQTVGRAVLRGVPSSGATSRVYGMLTLAATPPAARLFGGPVDEKQQIVAWVDPGGPQREQVRPGDRIVAVAGDDPTATVAVGMPWSGPLPMTIARDGARHDIVLAPEVLPRAVSFVIVDEAAPNALAVDGAVGVTTGLLDLVADDDALAAAIGHELAHITLGHTRPTVTAGGVLRGIVGTVLLPMDIAAPGSSGLFTGLIRGVENRFNRDQERDADRVGLGYAAAAGFDPSAALTLLDALQSRTPGQALGQFFDVHPPYPERRALLEAQLRAAPQ